MWDGSGPGGDEVGIVCLAEGEIFHLLDVGTSGEGLFAAGEDDGADGGVQVVVLQGGVEFGEESGGKSVEGAGTVESDCVKAEASARSAMGAGDVRRGFRTESDSGLGHGEMQIFVSRRR